MPQSAVRIAADGLTADQLLDMLDWFWAHDWPVTAPNVRRWRTERDL